MINKLLITMGVLALTGITVYQLHSASQENELRSRFMQFKEDFSKSYGSPSELEFRFGVFKTTVARVNKNNSDKTKTHTAGINKFSDLTFAEFKTMYLTDFNQSADLTSTEEVTFNGKASVDWRTTDGVGPVKNQAQCGSCWAFSTTASLEFATFVEDKRVVSLSEQELVDCSTTYGNNGCNGGLMAYAYDYIRGYKLALESNYPYRAVDGTCSSTNRAKPNREGSPPYSTISPANVNGLLAAAENQVVSVAIEVQNDFMDYSGGVYTSDPYCGYQLNHGVAVVGYNNSASVPYFIVRNSWGGSWGLEGYINMAVSTGSGTCGIANASDVFPNLS